MVNTEYKDKVFVCYSLPMDIFLQEKGLIPIFDKESYHKDGEGKEWKFNVYWKTKEFETLAIEWTHRKAINYKYFNDRSGT